MKLKTKLNYETRWFVKSRINPFKYQNVQAFNDKNKTNITYSTFSAYKRIWNALKLKDLEKASKIKKEVKVKEKKVKKAPTVKTTVVKVKAAKPVEKEKRKKTEVVKPEKLRKPKELTQPIKVEKKPKIKENLFFVNKILIRTKKKKKNLLEIVKIIEPKTQKDENIVSFYLKFYTPISELYIKEKIPENLKIKKIIPYYLEKAFEVQKDQKIQIWKIIPELGKNTYNFGYVCSDVSEMLDICPILKKKLPKTIIRIGTINEFEYKIANLCDGNRTIEDIVEETNQSRGKILIILKKLKDLGLITEKTTGDFPLEVLIPEMKLSTKYENILKPYTTDVFIPELHQTIQSY
ncbi:MAG: hypothetical protein ACTSRG_01460 [Candidatus Helarchaeota archaeon]